MPKRQSLSEKAGEFQLNLTPMIDAVFLRDLPTVRATAMIFATVYVILNLLADILSLMSNPRLMHPK